MEAYRFNDSKKKWPRWTFKALVVMFPYESLKLSVISSGHASKPVWYAETIFPRRKIGMIDDLLRIHVDPSRKNIPGNEQRLSAGKDRNVLLPYVARQLLLQ